MVQFLLEIKAELENLTNLQPQGGCDDPEFSYYFKLKCGNCGEVSQKETCVTLSEMVDQPKSRGKVHLVQKCKFCNREGSVLMIRGRGRPYTVEDSETQVFGPLMLFDIRGFEPVDFVFKDGWSAESITGTKYDNINFLEGDFVEYDEKGECPVGISELKYNFVVTK
uniref:CXXC motif containing zinc binding protein n=1 Tax=Araucaria cunninghamii TaxID=56994 RepID=A0A0D6R8U4_ARACU